MGATLRPPLTPELEAKVQKARAAHQERLRQERDAEIEVHTELACLSCDKVFPGVVVDGEKPDCPCGSPDVIRAL